MSTVLFLIAHWPDWFSPSARRGILGVWTLSAMLLGMFTLLAWNAGRWRARILNRLERPRR